MPAAQEQRNQIIVKDGDTLEKIAIRYYRSNAGISDLIKAPVELVGTGPRRDQFVTRGRKLFN